MKIPLYAMIGTSLAFLINYSFIDVFEFTLEMVHYEFCKRRKDTFVPLVVSNLQHYFLLVCTICMGILFGSMYGAVDFE